MTNEINERGLIMFFSLDFWILKETRQAHSITWLYAYRRYLAKGLDFQKIYILYTQNMCQSVLKSRSPFRLVQKYDICISVANFNTVWLLRCQVISNLWIKKTESRGRKWCYICISEEYYEFYQACIGVATDIKQLRNIKTFPTSTRKEKNGVYGHIDMISQQILKQYENDDHEVLCTISIAFLTSLIQQYGFECHLFRAARSWLVEHAPIIPYFDCIHMDRQRSRPDTLLADKLPQLEANLRLRPVT